MNPVFKGKNNKLKLMIITPYFYPKVGGLENYAYNIAKGLKEKYNWEVVVVTSNYKEKKDIEEELDGIRIYKLARWFKISNTPINPIWYFQIKKLIKKESPDVLNAHTPVPFISDISARVCGDIPLILTYHTGPMILKGRLFEDLLIRFYESFILKTTIKNTKKIICVSDFIRFDFLKDYINKTVTITPGVDLNRFKPKISNSKNRILFVGGLNRSERYKGLGFLLAAVNRIKEKIKDVKLAVVGDGDYINNYKRSCISMGIKENVEFKGILIGDELVEEYQKSNVLVKPSLSESFGIVLLEAMACKKPVIGTDIEGIPYLIENGENGLIVPPKDPEALANAIIRILENPKLAQKMGEEGYEKVIKSFAWENQLAKTDIILRC
jgi:glycosyltransferase involved in cell wall biosynthesis